MVIFNIFQRFLLALCNRGARVDGSVSDDEHTKFYPGFLSGDEGCGGMSEDAPD